MIRFPGVPARCACGFRAGDRVAMRSALMPGKLLHGRVGPWHAGCGHIVEWDGEPFIGTGLPNEHVQRDHVFVGELVETKRCERCGVDDRQRETLCKPKGRA